MTRLPIEVALLVALALAVAFVAWMRFLVPDPYADIGAGDLALDVPDRVPAEPPDSRTAQEEVEQLERAIATVRAARAAKAHVATIEQRTAAE